VSEEHSPLEAVIFDLDGVLVDSEPVHWRASQRLFAPHELPEAEYARFIGVAVEPYMLWARERFALDEPVELLAERYAAAVTTELEAGGLIALDGARALIEAARARGLRVALASQSIAVWVGATLRATGLDGLFDAVVTGDEVERGKPAPDVYLLAAERLGVAPARCLAIEDSPAGVQSAAAAGMRVVQSRQASSASNPVEPQPLARLVVGSLREVDLGRWPEWRAQRSAAR
jgi:HAD superfamily hydrolase (TIGR01509 family)